MRTSVLAAAAVVVAVVLGASSVHAADGVNEKSVAQAKKLYQQGSKAYQAEKYADALVAFQKANELDPRPIFWFNIGQCERRLGNAQAATDAYQRYLDASADAPNRAEVEKFIAELKATLPAVTTTTTAEAPPAPPPAPPEDRPPWALIGGVAAAGVVAVAGVAIAVSILSQPTLGKVDLRGGT